MGVSGQLHVAAALLPVKYLLHTLENKMLGGPQGLSKRYRIDKSFPCRDLDRCASDVHP